jgi:hypothetical protein
MVAGLAEARHADLLAAEHDVFRVEILAPVSCRDYSKAAALRAPLTRYNSCVNTQARGHEKRASRPVISMRFVRPRTDRRALSRMGSRPS